MLGQEEKDFKTLYRGKHQRIWSILSISQGRFPTEVQNIKDFTIGKLANNARDVSYH